MGNNISLDELAALLESKDIYESMYEDAEEFATQHIEGIGDVPLIYSVRTNNRKALEEIRSRIENGTIVLESPERIVPGTVFYGMFLKDDEGKMGEMERYILVGSNAYFII